MRKVNEIVENLKTDLKNKVKKEMKADQAKYKELLKNLLIQGLIKLMEGQIFIRCRKQDVEIIKSIQDEAVKAYKDMIIKEVVRFKGKSTDDIPCNIVIDSKYLESIDDNEATGSLGGFKLFAKKGRIVCSQTIDDRIDLCFQAAIPAIRYMLFPSMRTQK